MIHVTYPIQVKGSMPDAKLVTYIQEDSASLMIDERPLILLCPGGGYSGTSDREAESIALQFLAMGYHAAVLRYSCEPARFPTALAELASAVKLIRSNAEEWHVAADKIIVQGCSAGGHLAASLGMFWDEDFLAQEIGLEDHALIRPNGMILCYPVITAGEFAHRGSFECLLGSAEEADGQSQLLDKSILEKLSLEKQVSSKTPKTFIWHTFEDELVPVENSLLLVSALKAHGISTEFHMYAKGGHGLALANHLTQASDGGAVQEECTSWIRLAHTWLESMFGK